MATELIEIARESYSAELELRVREAVNAMLEEGARVSFYSVAKRAEVARSTLYRCGNLREIVEHARDGGRPADSSMPGVKLAAENVSLRHLVSRLEDDLAYQRGLSAHRLLRGAAYPFLYAMVPLAD